MLQADAAGSLGGIQAKLDGTGAGLALEVMADLAPRTPLVLRSARAEVRLPDQSTLSARLDLRAVDGQPGRDRIVGTVGARRLDLSPWLGDAIPPAIVSASAQLSAEFENLSQLRQAAIDLRFEDGARWNKQALAGAVKAQVDIAAPAAGPQASAVAPGPDAAQPVPDAAVKPAAGTPEAGMPEAAKPAATKPEAGTPAADLLAGLRIHGLDVDLKLGANRIRAQGEIGEADGALTLDAQAPQLDAFWPGIPGGADLKGKLGGTIAAHKAEITAGYNPPKPRPGVLGESRAQATLAFAGGWGKGAPGRPTPP